MRSPHWKSVIIFRYTLSPRMSYVIKCCDLICRYGVGYKPFSLNTRAVKHLIDSDGQVTSMPALIASSSPPASPMNQRPEKKQLNLRIRSTWHFKHRYRENFKGIFIVVLKSDRACSYLFISYYNYYITALNLWAPTSGDLYSHIDAKGPELLTKLINYRRSYWKKWPQIPKIFFRISL